MIWRFSSHSQITFNGSASALQSKTPMSGQKPEIFESQFVSEGDDHRWRLIITSAL
jgi:hypothetical protein